MISLVFLAALVLGCIGAPNQVLYQPFVQRLPLVYHNPIASYPAQQLLRFSPMLYSGFTTHQEAAPSAGTPAIPVSGKAAIIDYNSVPGPSARWVFGISSTTVVKDGVTRTIYIPVWNDNWWWPPWWPKPVYSQRSGKFVTNVEEVSKTLATDS